ERLPIEHQAKIAETGASIGRVDDLVHADRAGVEAPALADPTGLLFQTLPRRAVGRTAVIAEGEARFQPARPGRYVDGIAETGAAGGQPDLEALQRGDIRLRGR